MANPFFHNHWNPIRHSCNPQSQIQPQSTKPKIVNIPIQFVGPEIASNKQSRTSAVPTGEVRMASALAIQRAVRGFLVRKNVRIVRQVATEVEGIERKVREEEDEIRLDARKRLLVSETLMALLLRLDSVRGVRDLRKRVIRRVIGLQEAIDKAENHEGLRSEATEENITDQTMHLDEEVTATIESTKRDGAPIDGAISMSGMEEDPEATKEASINHDNATNQTLVGLVEVESPGRDNDLIMASDGTIPLRSLAEDEDSSIDFETETGVEIPAKAEFPKRKGDSIGVEIGEDESISSLESEQIPKADEEGTSMAVEESEPNAEAAVKERRGMSEMLERMAVENERLKDMVSQLCAASSEQCLLMKGLAERVEQLERVVHHRTDRRKKRRGAACSALSSAK